MSSAAFMFQCACFNKHACLHSGMSVGGGVDCEASHRHCETYIVTVALQSFKYFREPRQAVCKQLLPSKIAFYQAVPRLAVDLMQSWSQFMDLRRDWAAQLLAESIQVRLHFHRHPPTHADSRRSHPTLGHMHPRPLRLFVGKKQKATQPHQRHGGEQGFRGRV